MTYRYLRGKQEFGGSQTTIFEKENTLNGQQSLKSFHDMRKSMASEIDYRGTERKSLKTSIE